MMNENEQRAVAALAGAFVGWAQQRNRNTGRVLLLEQRVEELESDPILRYLRLQKAADLLAGVGFDGCQDAPDEPSDEIIKLLQVPPVTSTTEASTGLPGTFRTNRVIPGEFYRLGRTFNVPSVRAALHGLQVNDMSAEGRLQLYRFMKAVAKVTDKLSTSNKGLTLKQYEEAVNGFLSLGGAGTSSNGALYADIGTPSAVAVGATSGVLYSAAGLGTGTSTLYVVSSSPAEKNTLSSFNLRLSPAGTPASGEQSRISVPTGYTVDFAVDVEVHFGMNAYGGNIDGVKPYAIPNYSGGLLSYISVGVGTALTASTVYDLLLKVSRKA